MPFRLASLIAMLTLFPLTANAVLEFTVSGLNLTTLSSDLSLAVDGDMVELEIFIANTNGDGIAALEAGAFDIDPAGLTFVSGTSVGRVLSTLLGGVVHSGGIDNSTAGTSNGLDGVGNPLPRTLTAADVIIGGATVKFLAGLTTTIPSPSADGTQDLGVGGVTGAGDFPHAVIEFQVNGGGSTVTVGAGGAGLGDVIDGTGAIATGDVVNAVIQVPEASSLLASVSALTAVAGVVAVRRRIGR